MLIHHHQYVFVKRVQVAVFRAKVLRKASGYNVALGPSLSEAVRPCDLYPNQQNDVPAQHHQARCTHTHTHTHTFAVLERSAWSYHHTLCLILCVDGMRVKPDQWTCMCVCVLRSQSPSACRIHLQLARFLPSQCSAPGSTRSRPRG